MGRDKESTSSLAEIVRQEINAMPHVKTSLGDGIINYSALARKLIPTLGTKLGKKLNEESVIVSIKRYADELDTSEINATYLDSFANSELTLQDNMAYVHFRKTPKVASKIEELLRESDWRIGEMRIAIQGAEQVMLIAKKNRVQKLLDELEDEKLLALTDRALITFRMPLESYAAYGVIAELSQIIAKKGISIEIVTTPPDLHFLVDEKDAERTYTVLKEIINAAKGGSREKTANKPKYH
ncbi:MAG: ACT domain-containing protein [archaeon]